MSLNLKSRMLAAAIALAAAGPLTVGTSVVVVTPAEAGIVSGVKKAAKGIGGAAKTAAKGVAKAGKAVGSAHKRAAVGVGRTVKKAAVAVGKQAVKVEPIKGIANGVKAIRKKI